MSDISKIDVNRIVTDIAIKDGRIMDAVSLAKRGVQLVLEAATRSNQEQEAKRRDEIYGSYSTVVDMNSDCVFTTTTYDSFTPTEGEGMQRVSEQTDD